MLSAPSGGQHPCCHQPRVLAGSHVAGALCEGQRWSWDCNVCGDPAHLEPLASCSLHPSWSLSPASAFTCCLLLPLAQTYLRRFWKPLHGAPRHPPWPHALKPVNVCMSQPAPAACTPAGCGCLPSHCWQYPLPTAACQVPLTPPVPEPGHCALSPSRSLASPLLCHRAPVRPDLAGLGCPRRHQTVLSLRNFSTQRRTDQSVSKEKGETEKTQAGLYFALSALLVCCPITPVFKWPLQM